FESQRFEVEQPAEAADFGIRSSARSGAHQRLDQLHHPVAGIDIDTGLRVSEAALLFSHEGPTGCARFPGSYVENASRAMVEAPLYSIGMGALPGPSRVGPTSRDCLEYSKAHNAGAHSAGAGCGMGIASGAMWIAFVLFLAAGVSDAVDGYLAKRFQMTTE